MATRKPKPEQPRGEAPEDAKLRKAARKIADKARVTIPEEEKDADSDLTLNPFVIDASGDSALGAQDEVDWVKASGWTPLEFLTHTYRNGFQRMEHRIAAAKAVLDYAHRKLPARVEISGNVAGQNIALDAVALSKLTDKEIDQLLAMLEKIK